MAALSTLLKRYFYVQKRLGALIVIPMFVCLFMFAVSHPASASWTPPTHTWGGSADDSAASSTLDATGNLYIAGAMQSFGAGGSDALLLKYDAAGNLLWTRTWGGSAADYATAVAVDSFGSVYVTGGTDSFGAGWREASVARRGSEPFRSFFSAICLHQSWCNPSLPAPEAKFGLTAHYPFVSNGPHPT